MTETLQRKFIKPSSISKSLYCVICSDVFTQPTRLYCTHTFCHQCIQRCIKSNNSCPMCRTTIDKKNIGPDLIAQSIINDLEVFCPVQDCPWSGLNCQLVLHYNFQCTARDKEKKSGKSHMKNKVFNLEQLKDQEVEQKINQNVTKGSFQARLQAAFKRNNPSLNNYQISREEKKQRQQKKDESKKESNADFLESLFQ